jgi:hypothetical protein
MGIFDKISQFVGSLIAEEQEPLILEVPDIVEGIIIKGTYFDYLKSMRQNGWEVVTIDFPCYGIVQTNKLDRESYGTFLEIRCPAGHVLTFPGIEQFDFDENHFSKYPNLYKYPYFLNLRCYNEAGEEPYWSRIVEIKKIHTDSSYENISIEYYDDLHIKSDSRYKRLEERYYLKTGIELKSLEILRFSMVSDVDITKVELFGKADLFTI